MLKIKINEKFFSFDKKSLTNTLFRHKNVPTYFLNITNFAFCRFLSSLQHFGFFSLYCAVI